MTTISSRRRRFLYCLPLAGILLALQSCSNESFEPPPAEENIPVTLRLSIVPSHLAGGRSRITKADETYFQPAAEKCEELRSLRVILASGDTIEENRILTLSGGEDISGDRLAFTTIPGHKRIYLFGNEEILPENVQDLLKSATAGKQTPDFAAIQLSRTADNPLYDLRDPEKRDYLPMSEFFDVTVMDPEGDTGYTQEESLFLTRAVSKFSFRIRKSADFSGTGNEQIRAIRISSIGKREYLLPNATEYSPAKYDPSNNPYEGRYVTTYSVPTDDNAKSDFIYTLPVPVAPASLPEEGYSWSPRIYLPETAGESFSCSISYDGETWLPSAELPNLPSLPRNTHAIVDITVGNGNSMNLEVNVLPWDVETFTFDYSENVGIASDGALSFRPGTYAMLDKPTGTLLLSDFPASAAGGFRIATPAGARWDAYLITTGGEQGAIRFLTGTGSTQQLTDHISGAVGGEGASFNIRASGHAGESANTAIMIVTVTMGNGTTVPVNILSGGGYGSGIEHITIIQNPQ